MKLIVFLVVFSISFSLACLNCRRRKTCEDDTWTLINRTLGPWCVKVLLNSITSYSTAVSECASVGAVLSSIESEAEFAIELDLTHNHEASWYMCYIGVKVKEECACTDFLGGIFDYCSPLKDCAFQDAYEWTDNFTVGTTMMNSKYDYEYNSDVPGYYQYLAIAAHGMISASDSRFDPADGTTFYALCGKQAT